MPAICIACNLDSIYLISPCMFVYKAQTDKHLRDDKQF